jgi:fucose 4-O-acetylase-like acetyltransferase
MLERDCFYDNAKALLIFLVVLGHFVFYVTPISKDMKTIFFFIYLFHMPLFIFISGIFSKSTINRDRFKIERVLSFLILYIFLKLCYYILIKFFSENTNKFSLLIESDLPWFMLAIATWLSFTYLLKEIKPVVLITTTIIISLLAGYDPKVGDYLSVSRIIVYYPYFLLGYYLDATKISEYLKNEKISIAGWSILILVIIVISTQIEHIYHIRPLLTGRNPYMRLKNIDLGLVYRMLLYVVIPIVSFAILAILPHKKTFYTYIGTRTLQIYFLHDLILKIYHKLKMNDYLSTLFPVHWLKVYILLSIPLTLVLALKTIEWPFKKITSLKFRKILIEKN